MDKLVVPPERGYRRAIREGLTLAQAEQSLSPQSFKRFCFWWIWGAPRLSDTLGACARQHKYRKALGQEAVTRRFSKANRVMEAIKAAPGWKRS